MQGRHNKSHQYNLYGTFSLIICHSHLVLTMVQTLCLIQHPLGQDHPPKASHLRCIASCSSLFMSSAYFLCCGGTQDNILQKRGGGLLDSLENLQQQASHALSGTVHFASPICFSKQLFLLASLLDQPSSVLPHPLSRLAHSWTCYWLHAAPFHQGIATP